MLAVCRTRPRHWTQEVHISVMGVSLIFKQFQFLQNKSSHPAICLSTYLQFFIHTVSPGRKPGTSSKVMIGMLKASQKRTNLAPFTDALMSRHPAATFGWLATMPTVRPFMRAYPTMMFFAWSAMISKKSRSSTIYDRSLDEMRRDTTDVVELIQVQMYHYVNPRWLNI